MDNLGILKAIVGALSNANGKQNGQSGEQTQGQSQKQGGNQPFNFGKILESFKKFTQNNNQTANQNEGQPANAYNTPPPPQQTAKNNPITQGVTAPPPPLQSGMLSVMNDHDKFVKRVLEKTTSNKN